MFYINYYNIYNFVDVELEVQSETYLKYRSNGLKMKKICEKETFIRQHMTKLLLIEIEQFDLIKSSFFKFLPN